MTDWRAELKARHSPSPTTKGRDYFTRSPTARELVDMPVDALHSGQWPIRRAEMRVIVEARSIASAEGNTARYGVMSEEIDHRIEQFNLAKLEGWGWYPAKGER